MKVRRLPRILCGLLAPIAFCSVAQARVWTALYAFGDSYTDSGAGYVDGNGPTAVVYLALRLGIPFTYAGDNHAAGKSLNFAVSGAQTGVGEGFRIRPVASACGNDEALLGRGIRNQVLDFATRARSGAIRFDAEKTLFFIAGGLNDGSVPTATTIANLEDSIQQIYNLGGRYFLVALLPTKIPAFSAVGSRLNPAIAKIPEQLRAGLPGAHVAISKWGQYFDQVIDSPARYGIFNVTDTCAARAQMGEDPTPCASPETYFYFHAGHPSTAVQRVVGGELEDEVSRAFE